MMYTALLMRPWIMLMRELEVTPRVLADDLSVTAFGQEHLTRFVKGIDATHNYIDDMGGQLAPEKSMNCSIDAETTRWLKKHIQTTSSVST